MARYQATVDTDWAPENAFAYLSDFSNAPDWDPGTVKAERLDQGPIAEGSEFRLVAEFLGRRTELTYRVIEYDPRHAVTFLGENATATSRDRITFEPSGTGTLVAYDADLRLKGPLRAADPLLALAFRRVGNRARDGLAAALARPYVETSGAIA
ncbi:MAG TPA: SRPBCC family protein [Chloroflexota bacterium]|nr:SRPBCC family protein [Chloroflexota bacterium]